MEIQQDKQPLAPWLLDLKRMKLEQGTEEFSSLALLKVIEQVGLAQESHSLFHSLNQGVGLVIGYHQFAILESNQADPSTWLCTHSNHDDLLHSVWLSGQAFEKGLRGETQLLARPLELEEFDEQPTQITLLAKSLLITSVKTNLSQRLVLLFKQEAQFTAQNLDVVRLLTPIVEQKLQNIEFEQKLYQMVEQRTHELKLSQERMSAFIQASDGWFWEIDKEYCFTYIATPRHTQGNAFQGSMLGKNLMEVRSAREKTLLNKWFAATRMLQNREQIQNFEFELQLDKHSTVWMRINGNPIYDKQGVFAGYRGVSTNITQYMNEQEQLNQQWQTFSSVSTLPATVERTAQVSHQSLNILLVDDCKSGQMITQMMLMNLGHKVVVVSSGASALALAEQLFDFNLMLMDLNMPDMAGEEVCQQIRAQGVSVPIMAISGCRYEDRAEQVLAAGMSGFIEKPVKLNILRELLASIEA